MRPWLASYSRALLLINLLLAHAVFAQEFDIHGPAGSGAFGTSVTALPNGDIVVTDPGWSSGTGAVYLYSADGKTLISTLTGGSSGDKVGSGGVTVLPDGNYVVASPQWRNPSSGASMAGAVTWCHATTGCGDADVSATNSLIGSQANDRVGADGLFVLSNGKYVVLSSSWNYVSGSGSLGAATLCDATGKPVGAVSSANSLVGGTHGDAIGATPSSETPGVVPLGNGNYVVVSPYWNDPISHATQVGAVTWVSGTSGATGTVSRSNSLYGSTTGDSVGNGGAISLGASGRYVVNSNQWNNGVPGSNVGAVTWSGSSGIVGAVSTANSLYGTHASDAIGLGGRVAQGVIALTNGNYAVASNRWNNYLGAVTWGNGATGTKGAVDSSNSLVGTGVDDEVGYGVQALSNGNYVITSQYWNGTKGAVTWLSGNAATTGAGVISAANSLVGSNAGDYVGYQVRALTNGNYVVLSAGWNSGTGAATWSNGSSGANSTKGTISAANSLIGYATNDNFANDDVVALSNGNYVLRNRFTFGNKGAVTWGNGTSGVKGTLSSSNSLVGSVAGDQVGIVYALKNGNYVVVSPNWSNGAMTGAGAVTWASGTGGITGTVSASNSVLGSSASEHVGAGNGVYFLAANNGSYVFPSVAWSNNGATTGAGAVTLQRGNGPYAGTIDSRNSVFGQAMNSGNATVFDYDSANDELVVGRQVENVVALLRADELFGNGFEKQ